MRSTRVLVVSLLSISSMLVAVPAIHVLAQEGAAPQQTPAGAATSERPQATEYVVKVRDAILRAKNRDYEAAFEVLREAFRMEPSNPMAFYYAGEIDRLQNNLPQAMERFRTCVQFAGRSDAPRYHARCLQAMAETLERTEGQIEAAREAWQTYVEFADAHRNVSNPEIGRERINAIDAQMQQAGEYVAVRERIQAREEENARPRANMTSMRP
jgi:tetratricopeptide (TPR) repeat protein